MSLAVRLGQDVTEAFKIHSRAFRRVRDMCCSWDIFQTWMDSNIMDAWVIAANEILDYLHFYLIWVFYA